MTSLLRRFLALPILRKQSVVQATIIISTLTFLSKFIGYAREVLIAKYFGTSWQLDAYLVGSQIPMMVLGLFAGGFGTLIIPKYLEYKKRDQKDAIRYVNQIFFVWGFIFLLVSLLTVVFAPFLVHIVAFGFKGDRYDLAVKITRYLSLYGLLNILMSLLIGILQSEKQFLIPSITIVTGNTLTLLSLILLTKYFGIQSLTIGSTLLTIFNFIILFTILYNRYHFFRVFKLIINWNEIRDFAYLLLPLIVSSGVGTLNALADRTVASTLPVGSISSINFASRIWGIPSALIAIPFLSTLLPHFSEKACDTNRLLDFKLTINKALIFMFYFMVPISILLITLSHPIVKILFQRGAFNSSDTIVTANINRMYSLGLVAFSITPILGKVFVAFKNIWTLVFVSICTVALNFIGNIILSKYMGASGIALSTSVASTIGYIALYYILKRYFCNIHFNLKTTESNLVMEFIKILICSLLIGSISLLLLPILNISGLFIVSFSKLVILVVSLSVIYILLTILFQTEGYALIKPYIVKIKR